MEDKRSPKLKQPQEQQPKGKQRQPRGPALPYGQPDETDTLAGPDPAPRERRPRSDPAQPPQKTTRGDSEPEVPEPGQEDRGPATGRGGS
jgi:hypothetical protein